MTLPNTYAAQRFSSYFSFSVFQKPLKLITATHTYHYLSLLFFHPVLQFPLGSFLLYLSNFVLVCLVVFFRWVSIFGIVSVNSLLLLYQGLCVVIVIPCYFIFHIVVWYYCFMVRIFSLGLFFLGLLFFFFHHFWMSSHAYQRTGLMSTIHNVVFDGGLE